MIKFNNIVDSIPTIARTLLIILFVYAASSKFLDFSNFQIQLGQSPILTAYAEWVSWGIPILELLIVAFLSFPKYVYYAFFASYSLMIMFTTYIIIILNFSDFIPCSCGGVLEKLSWTEHMLLNVLLIAIAILGIVFTTNKNHKTNKLL
ncbi:MauE/DoxX family redox-associated membrane protein [uncultured Winogradskyella sp.]|uniref:MauE/DoxX family redox-associated membrane protein n=1 Tax=uncultured Winogradskyella sp. TaxID=395353 RepID=UPI002622AF14|nr:MauE/DoxX family redox-associated membrane protein [uncultured Winogradskyella sp.]